MVPATKLSLFLSRSRTQAAKSYFEYTVAGLWQLIDSNQKELRRAETPSRSLFIEPASCAITFDHDGGLFQLYVTTKDVIQDGLRVFQTRGATGHRLSLTQSARYS